jgi:hypothetical protein
MRSYQSSGIPIRAADCNGRPSAINRPSSVAAGTYGCENGHLEAIISADGRQNENKALCLQEIGQNNKKITGSAPVGGALPIALLGVLLGKLLDTDGWMRSEIDHIRASNAHSGVGVRLGWTGEMLSPSRSRQNHMGPA